MTNEEFEKVRNIAKKVNEESYMKFRMGAVDCRNIYHISKEKEDEMNAMELIQRKNAILSDLSKRQIFPCIEEDKLVFKKVSYNFDNEFFEYLDKILGITHGHIEEYSSKQNSDYLLNMFGIDEIEEKIMSYSEFVEFASKNSEYKDNLDKLKASYNKNPINYKFKLTTYIEHSKIYLIIKSMMNVFDLSQIYLSLCEFFNLKYSYDMLGDKQYSILYCSTYTKEFNEKEKNLSDDEKKELLKLIFSKISIDTICEVKFNMQDEITNIYNDIALRNTAILNDESFKTILSYINDEASIDKVKYKRK